MSRLVEPTSGLGRLLSHLVTDSAVGLLYFVMFALFVFASFVLGPNANSLHRLYRDRLSNAFLFRRKRPEDGGPNPVTAISYLRLSRLNHKFSPYHLINSALKNRGMLINVAGTPTFSCSAPTMSARQYGLHRDQRH
jgi:hypothetical protein